MALIFVYFIFEERRGLDRVISWVIIVTKQWNELLIS